MMGKRGRAGEAQLVRKAPDAVLEVRDLTVTFKVRRREVQAVRGVSFSVRQGETLAIVGESGSGKSATALAALGLLTETASASGEVLIEGHEILGLSDRKMTRYRGRQISMIFQEPMTALNPTMTVGRQLTEILGDARGRSMRARSKAEDLLTAVGIGDATRVLDLFPHALSGGMQQRVTIAIAIANEPSLLIADEPTTALDVTIQAQILSLLSEIQARTGMAIIFITHDLGVVAEIADRVEVFYGGRIVESGMVSEVFAEPMHPYTAGLIASHPSRSNGSDTNLYQIPGSPPDPLNLPTGCPFGPRCEFATIECEALPELLALGDARRVRCIYPQKAAHLIRSPRDSR